jgi:hypothetical protein
LYPNIDNYGSFQHIRAIKQRAAGPRFALVSAGVSSP